MNFARSALFAAFCVGLCLAATGQADEKPSVATPTGRAAIERLIADLRSPNRDPNPRREPFTGYPKDYDVAAQKSVEAARQKLLALGTEAFPALIDHADDAAYSLSISTSILASQSVGEVCRQIIESQISPVVMTYKSRPGADGKWHGFPSFRAIQYLRGRTYREVLQEWWQMDQSRQLRDMQIEALRWQIDHEQKIGFASAKDREEYLAPLLKMLEERTTARPKAAAER